jgi:hypothetical protein
MSRRRGYPPPPPPPEVQGPPGQDDGGGGFLKMIVIQSVQGWIIGRKKWRATTKFLCLIAILIGLLSYDINNFF